MYTLYCLQIKYEMKYTYNFVDPGFYEMQENIIHYLSLNYLSLNYLSLSNSPTACFI